MTPADPAHPADLAREALRAARRRARSLPEPGAPSAVPAGGERGAGERPCPTPASGTTGGDGPGDRSAEAGPVAGSGGEGRDAGTDPGAEAGRGDDAGRADAPGFDGADGRESAVVPGDSEARGTAGCLDGRTDERAPRPADAARAALRAAVTDKGTERAEQRAEQRDGTPTPDAEPRPGPGPRPDAAPRPGDIAREALRAARRDALRAEAEAERAGRRTAGRSSRAGAEGVISAAGSSEPPADTSRAARLKAAGEMRQFLKTAFRMPPETDAAPETGTALETDAAPEIGTAPGGASAPERSGSAGAAPAHSGPEPAGAAPAHSGPEPTGTAPGRPGPEPVGTAPGYAPAPEWSEPAGAAPAHPGPEPAGAGPARPGAEPAGAASAHPEPEPAPAVPHAPPTMATPHRDGEHRRTFPAFAPRGERAGEGPFAGTWWGNAWVAALERSALDAKRVARGRGYADQGHVDAITVTPGSVLAYVRGSRPRPYRVQVRVRTLADAEWERFLDAAADRPGHIAALLDKELPHSLADCGVPLLPGPGDLAPRCTCPDSGHPCKHAAALCYQTARLLDADPFVLLLLRGRGERELLDALSRRSAARAARDGQGRASASLPGIRATEALAPRDLPPLPPPAPVPAHPEQPPAYPAAPGGPDPFALDQLATDAAARAQALLATGRDPVGDLSLWQDAVRLAAARPGSGLTATTRALYATLARATDRTPADLARAVAAWRQGGAEGLAVLEEPWDPPAGRFDRARPLLLAADLPAFRPWRNRLTHPLGHVQLRLGRDGLWYVYESEPGEEDWWPRGTPDLDPVGALTGLGALDGT
ncbi:SWIM zinc finger family protein [Streptomyces sp. AM6-12]|uniref:SWIM zinc finger family protein n=1 Tax=Streptomyces sp. AM6-12 TaxID=3345149 RepID=UPI00379ECC8E